MAVGHGAGILPEAGAAAAATSIAAVRRTRRSDLGPAARALLDGNWREGTYRGRRYAFSVPSPRSYPWQWYWDSCFHAIVRARFDPAGARAELETLLTAADPDGFIGHTVLWGHPLDLSGRSATTSPRART